VKPAPFTYHRPRTREEVDSLLAEYGTDAKILAGGQSLIPILNMRLASPAHLIDINHLEDEPAEPELDDGFVRFGPLVRQETAERSDVVRTEIPLLVETLKYVAHPAIRTRGTIVGSIAHSDPAAELPSLLTVLGGKVHSRSSGGSRNTAGGGFCTGPLENCLGDAEWVDEVSLPVKSPGQGFAFLEFARRSGDYALCGVAAVATPADGAGRTIALSYLGMGERPLRLETPPLDDADVNGSSLEAIIGELVDEHLDPVDDIHATAAYRSWLARRLGATAARTAWREGRDG
jgi:carbon-monoxide dehydrogenase medium subunit